MKGKHLLLNIGLAPSALLGGPSLTQSNVCDALTIAGATVTHARIAHSNTEETAALRIRIPDWCRDHQHIASFIYSLSLILRQEAIAWSYASAPSEGWLHGPHASAWGAFDYDRFILPPCSHS